MTVNWSSEIPFNRDDVRRNIPDKPGVYEVLQSSEYPRYLGTTRILEIGRSISNLLEEILNHFQRHTVANRLKRIQNRQGVMISVIYAVMNPTEVPAGESELLKEFEDRHWDLPVLNSQRGYKRDEDRHYRDSAV